jgi:hypothetical protein
MVSLTISYDEEHIKRNCIIGLRLSKLNFLEGRAMVYFQQYFTYIVASVLLVEETGIPGENHRLAARH